MDPIASKITLKISMSQMPLPGYCSGFQNTLMGPNDNRDKIRLAVEVISRTGISCGKIYMRYKRLIRVAKILE